MTDRASHTRCLPLLAGLLLAACPGEPVTPAADGGTPAPDSGARADAGAPADAASTGADAATEADASLAGADAAAAPDSGPAAPGDAGPELPVGLVEAAATPVLFESFSITYDDEQPTIDISGTITLAAASDGFDPVRDRVVVAVGDRSGVQPTTVEVFDPGALACTSSATGPQCTFDDAARPLVRHAELAQTGQATWSYRFSGGPTPTTLVTAVVVRLGDDWGGASPSGSPIDSLRLDEDPLHAASAQIGPAGGSLSTRLPDGLVLTLDVPPGALAAPTTLTLTPLRKTPLLGAGALPPGVSLTPHGLALAEPATLTFDYGLALAPPVLAAGVGLATSPLSQLPLPSRVDAVRHAVSVRLRHFSVYGPVAGTPGFADLAAWADPILAAAGQPSLGALEQLFALADAQQLSGCTAGCIDLAALRTRAEAAAALLVAEACPVDIADPSRGAVEHWVSLEALVQRLGLSVPPLLDCLKQVVSAAVDAAGADGLARPFDDGPLRWLIELLAVSQQLGLADQEQAALAKIDAVLASSIAAEKAAGVASPSEASLDRLEWLMAQAQLLGRTALEALALEGIDSVLRAQVARGTQACAAALGSGLPDLLRARARYERWQAPLAAVDATLGADIEAAIDACTPTVELVVKGGPVYDPACGTGPFSGPAFAAIQAPGLGGIVACSRQDFATDQPVPVTATATSGTAPPTLGDYAAIDWTLARTGPRKFTLSSAVTLHAYNNYARVQANFGFAVRSAVPGVLEISIHPWTGTSTACTSNVSFTGYGKPPGYTWTSAAGVTQGRLDVAYSGASAGYFTSGAALDLTAMANFVDPPVAGVTNDFYANGTVVEMVFVPTL